MDASEIHAKRLNAKEVLTPMNGEKIIVPIADGTVKLSGGDQVLRTSTLLNPGSPRPRRRTRKSSRRIRRVFTTYSKLVHWHHHAQDAFRVLLRQDQRQQPTVELIKDAFCLLVALQRPLTRLYDLCCLTSDECSTVAPNSSPSSMTGTFGSSRIASLMLSTLRPPDQSILNSSHSRSMCRQHHAQTPFSLSCLIRLNCLGGHLHIQGDSEPSPVVLGEHATMEKTTRRFRDISATLAELNAERLHAQTVNDLLTMYVAAASQHVLRMSFCTGGRSQEVRH